MKYIKKLKERASNAFDLNFRDKMQNAVLCFILNNGKIATVISSCTYNSDKQCKCPEGCLFENLSYPCFDTMDLFGFSKHQHYSFQLAFDTGIDSDTPEAALGLLYRNKFIK